MVQQVTQTIHDGTTSSLEHNSRTDRYMSKAQRIDGTDYLVKIGKLKSRVDTRLTKNNEFVQFETLENIYKQEFEDAYQEWKKNKKDPRGTYKNYLASVRAHKQKSEVREVLIAVNRTENQQKECINILKKEINAFKKKLELTKAGRVESYAIHVDEIDAEIHAHIRFVPIGRNYKRGAKVQNSWKKCLQGMGYKQGIEKKFGKEKTLQGKFYQDYRNYCEKIIKEELGDVEIVHQKGKKYIEMVQYKSEGLENKIENQKSEIKFNEQVLDKKKVKLSQLKATSTEQQKTLKERNKKLKKLKQISKDYKKQIEQINEKLKIKNEFQQIHLDLTMKYNELNAISENYGSFSLEQLERKLNELEIEQKQNQ